MSAIKIIKKPNDISWDEIHEVVYQAHASNREQGVDIRNAHLSGEELKNSIGEDGVCFVALDGDKVVATSSLAFHCLHTWYANGKKVGYGTLSAVLPEYKGQHIFSRLERTRMAYAKDVGCYGFYGKTAEGNKKRRNIAKKDGYYEVSIGRTSFNPHNYVTIFKWFEKCPHSTIYIKYKYLMTYLRLKINLFLGRIK